MGDARLGSSLLTHVLHSTKIARSPRRTCTPTSSAPPTPSPCAPSVTAVGASAESTARMTGTAARRIMCRTRHIEPEYSPIRSAALIVGASPLEVGRTKSDMKARVTLGDAKAIALLFGKSSYRDAERGVRSVCFHRFHTPLAWRPRSRVMVSEGHGRPWKGGGSWEIAHLEAVNILDGHTVLEPRDEPAVATLER